jgi:F-type H+-transporting ATPase subunit alpha
MCPLLGALLFLPTTVLSCGSNVKGSCKLSTLNLSLSALGSIIGALGTFLVSNNSLSESGQWIIECQSPAMLSRSSVFEPLSTGILSLDSLVPLGRGQRELLIGDRQVGKTSLGVDTILNQYSGDTLCLIVAIGQRASTLLSTYFCITLRMSASYTLTMSSTASVSAVLQYLSAYAGSSFTDFFMRVHSISSFVFLDDLSKQACAYREVCLILRRSPGREAFPGDIFFVHSRLLERSAKLGSSLGGGSVTSFPVIETLAGDVSGYISTNVISITDGQIFLSCDLFISGFKPSVEVGLSVTRIGAASQSNQIKLASGSYKLELAQLVDLQSFSQFSGDLGSDSLERLARGHLLLEILKQPVGACRSLHSQLRLLYMSTCAFLSRIALSQVAELASAYISLPLFLSVMVPLAVLSYSCFCNRQALCSRNKQ